MRQLFIEKSVGPLAIQRPFHPVLMPSVITDRARIILTRSERGANIAPAGCVYHQSYRPFGTCSIDKYFRSQMVENPVRRSTFSKAEVVRRDPHRPAALLGSPSAYRSLRRAGVIDASRRLTI
jgi:hypothetical protein